MKKIKIGIDLDDTVWEFQSEFIKFYNSKFGTNYLLSDQKEYNYEDFFGISTQESIDLLADFAKTKSFLKLPLIEGVLDFFKEIKKNYEIYFITARPIKRKDSTIKCFINHFGEEKKIHFIGRGSIHYGKIKGDLGVELGIKFMIDDHLNNLMSCVDKGINCFLINQPWNVGFGEVTGIIRINKLKDSLKYLEGVN